MTKFLICVLMALAGLTACSKSVNLPTPNPTPDAPVGPQEVLFFNSSSSWIISGPTHFEREAFTLPESLEALNFPQISDYPRLVFYGTDGVCVYSALGDRLVPDVKGCQLSPPIFLEIPPESAVRFISQD